MTAFALFRADGELLVPQDVARSLWKHDQMHGVATSGALARAAEHAVIAADRTDLRPARFTVDLFRAPSMGPCASPRSWSAKAPDSCSSRPRCTRRTRRAPARSHSFSRRRRAPTAACGRRRTCRSRHPWTSRRSRTSRACRSSSAIEIGWSQNFAEHQNSDRKMTWQSPIPVVVGEKTTPFQGLAGAADSTSMVCNWGEQGVQYINTDVNLSISRLPRQP